MNKSLSGSAEPIRFLSGVPFHVAAHRRTLLWIHGLASKHCIEGCAQINAVERHVVAGAAAIELTAIQQGLQAIRISVEQIKLWGAGGPQGLGQALFLVQQVGKVPAPTLA
jgi:hypothetical protein